MLVGSVYLNRDGLKRVILKIAKGKDIFQFSSHKGEMGQVGIHKRRMEDMHPQI